MNFLNGWFDWNWLAGAFVPLVALLLLTARPAWRAVQQHQAPVVVGMGILAVLWSLRASVEGGHLGGMNYHLLGMSLLALMLDAPAALWVGTIMLGAYTVILRGVGGLEVLGLNALVTVVLPVGVCWLLRWWSHRKLPHNLFIYILVNGFLAAALGMLLTGAVISELMWLAESHAVVPQWSSAMLVFFLIAWGEAFLTGLLTAVFVALMPRLLITFDDELYLRRQADIWK